jgi:hypothetical protein
LGFLIQLYRQGPFFLSFFHFSKATNVTSSKWEFFSKYLITQQGLAMCSSGSPAAVGPLAAVPGTDAVPGNERATGAFFWSVVTWD